MMFNSGSIKHFFQVATGRTRKLVGAIPELEKPARLLLLAAATVFVLVALFWVADNLVLYFLTQTYIGQVADVFDFNEHLKTAFLIATFVVSAIFSKYVWSLSKKRRMVGIAGIAAMLIGHSVALWYGTKDKYFDSKGDPIKCYVLTRDGKVIYREHPGIDPATGRSCRPITPEMLERLKQYEFGKRPQRIVTTSDADPVFFDPRSGEPMVWYSTANDHTIALFDLMGFNPDTGDELVPITHDVVETWKKQEGGRQRRVPKLISDPDKYVFFDPRNGEARAWYWSSADGRYEFYDSPGFRPQTGDELQIVTREVHGQWEKKGDNPKPPMKAPNRMQINKDTIFFDPVTGNALLWYWRRGSADYELFDGPGFHPQNGELLKSFSHDTQTQYEQEMADKAQQAEQRAKEQAAIQSSPKSPARAPNRVQIGKDTVFFDPVTGNPLLWYWRRGSADYELFDGPGFHPQNGELLKSFSHDTQTQYEQEIADKAQQDEQKAKEQAAKQSSPKSPARAPNRVQIGKDTVFFDPVTGSPLLWYWRRGSADYEFFDGPGFHPQNGESLKSFTKESLTQYQQELDDKAKQTKLEQDRIQAEQKAQEDANERRQREQQQREQAQQQKRADELQRASLVARQCDELAANPSDAHKVGEGVAYGDLKPRAADAVAACELAADQNPNEQRFKYQLARALELTGDGAVRIKNRQRAFDIHQSLVRAGYSAAFDNLGSLYRWDKKDLASAVALFRKGTSLGDSDSMVSLADLIESGQVIPSGPNEAPLQLHKRAAELGNASAARAYQDELAKAQEMQQQRTQQLQQQQMMNQFFGTILRNIH
jgi:hypothetical protein